jgi:hypothetical protein
LISPIASLMWRRQCMLTELKELTEWLNVKILRQEPPRWLRHPFYGQHLNMKRRIFINNNIPRMNNIYFQRLLLFRHLTTSEPVRKRRDIAVTQTPINGKMNLNHSMIIRFISMYFISFLLLFVTILANIMITSVSRWKSWNIFNPILFTLTNHTGNDSVTAISLDLILIYNYVTHIKTKQKKNQNTFFFPLRTNIKIEWLIFIACHFYHKILIFF